MPLSSALQRQAEPHEGSANSQLCRATAQTAGSSKLSGFLQLTFPIMPTQPCISIHKLRGCGGGERKRERERERGHWGEEESQGEKEDSTKWEYSGALSLAGSFNLSISAFFIQTPLLSLTIFLF